MPILILGVLLAAQAAPSPTGAQPPPEPQAASPSDELRFLRVAVTDLDLGGVDERLGRVVTNSLVDEIRKLARTSVIGMDEVRALLEIEADRALMGCEDDNSCLSEIADALGADIVVIGGIAKVEDQSVIQLRAVLQSEAKVVGEFSRRLEAAGGEELLAAVGPAIEELFPDRPLRQGATRGVAPEVALLLNPPPVAPWMTLSVAGVAAGSGLLAASVIVANVGVYLSHTLGVQGAISQGALVTKEELETQMLVVNLLGAAAAAGVLVTAGLAGTAGGLAFFTDWRGYGDALE